ncbi:MAG: hypothetical protein LKJ03_11175 [Enterococcaceae bacterium]|jgi:hypothetical protein|nr:hypothetical protein [Enterococcaceae bacterium]
MDLTTEAIKYLTQLKTKPEEHIVDIGNDRYLVINDDGNVQEIIPTAILANDPLEINTLSGMIKYIKANLDRVDKPLILQVKNETQVLLMGTLASDGRRETLAVAQAIIPYFDFNNFLDSENFVIAFQSKFVRNNDRDILLQVMGKVVEESVKDTGDDGISQAISIRSGVASKADVKVPNPVTLIPYRTFVEVKQPESKFVFRMKDGPRGAIFEADGGAWRNQAISNIREYLENNLREEISKRKITIIA